MILANATHSADQVIGRLDRWGTGGGAGSIKEQLHPAPLTVAGDIPVLCLDSRYSRHLNREGLYLMGFGPAAGGHHQEELIAEERLGGGVTPSHPGR